MEAALRLKPDLIVLDITMPLLNGIDAAVQIKKSLPSVKLLFVTMHVSPAYLEAALDAGGDWIRTQICRARRASGRDSERPERTHLCKPESFG